MNITYKQQSAELTEIRAGDVAWKSIPTVVPHSALRRLHKAFDAFFKRVRTGGKPGFPRFRSYDRYNSFGIGRVTIDGDRVNAPKLGFVRFKLYRPIKGHVRDVSIVKTPGRWLVCVACNLGPAPLKRPARSPVGVDVGLEAFATLSNGERIDTRASFALQRQCLNADKRY